MFEGGEGPREGNGAVGTREIPNGNGERQGVGLEQPRQTGQEESRGKLGNRSDADSGHLTGELSGLEGVGPNEINVTYEEVRRNRRVENTQLPWNWYDDTAKHWRLEEERYEAFVSRYQELFELGGIQARGQYELIVSLTQRLAGGDVMLPKVILNGYLQEQEKRMKSRPGEVLNLELEVIEMEMDEFRLVVDQMGEVGYARKMLRTIAGVFGTSDINEIYRVAEEWGDDVQGLSIPEQTLGESLSKRLADIAQISAPLLDYKLHSHYWEVMAAKLTGDYREVRRSARKAFVEKFNDPAIIRLHEEDGFIGVQMTLVELLGEDDAVSELERRVREVSDKEANGDGGMLQKMRRWYEKVMRSGDRFLDNRWTDLHEEYGTVDTPFTMMLTVRNRAELFEWKGKVKTAKGRHELAEIMAKKVFDVTSDDHLDVFGHGYGANPDVVLDARLRAYLNPGTVALSVGSKGAKRTLTSRRETWRQAGQMHRAGAQTTEFLRTMGLLGEPEWAAILHWAHSKDGQSAAFNVAAVRLLESYFPALLAPVTSPRGLTLFGKSVPGSLNWLGTVLPAELRLRVGDVPADIAGKGLSKVGRVTGLSRIALALLNVRGRQGEVHRQELENPQRMEADSAALREQSADMRMHVFPQIAADRFRKLVGVLLAGKDHVLDVREQARDLIVLRNAGVDIALAKGADHYLHTYKGGGAMMAKFRDKSLNQVRGRWWDKLRQYGWVRSE